MSVKNRLARNKVSMLLAVASCLSGGTTALAYTQIPHKPALIPLESDFQQQLSQGAEVGELIAALNDLLDKAIEELSAESGDWRQTLTNLERELLDKGLDKAAIKVKELTNELVINFGQGTRCSIDFIAESAASGLERIKANASSKKFTPSPRFCQSDPAIIELVKQESTDRPLKATQKRVLISGYNLDGDIKAFMFDKGGKKSTRISSEHLTKPTRYSLVLNTGSNGVKFDEYSQYIQFETPDETYTISVAQPDLEAKHRQLIKLRGKVRGKDAGWKQRYQNHSIKTDILLTSRNPEFTYKKDMCTGEGRKSKATLNISFQLQPKSGRVTYQGTTQLLKGFGSCSSISNSHDDDTFTGFVEPDQTETYNRKLEDLDYADFALSISNSDAPPPALVRGEKVSLLSDFGKVFLSHRDADRSIGLTSKRYDAETKSNKGALWEWRPITIWSKINQNVKIPKVYWILKSPYGPYFLERVGEDLVMGSGPSNVEDLESSYPNKNNQLWLQTGEWPNFWLQDPVTLRYLGVDEAKKRVKLLPKPSGSTPDAIVHSEGLRRQSAKWIFYKP